MSAVLTLHRVAKRYGERLILNDASCVLNVAERVGLAGPNGVGKSTLLKIITGEITPDAGEVLRAPDVRLGYLAQVMAEADAAPDQTLGARLDAAQADLSALEARMRALEARMAEAEGEALDAALAEYGEVADRFERGGGYEREARVAAVLDGLGVAGIDRARPFGTLSGGEKTRVGLALLLLSAPDALLLDEPTNHLDHAALAWLEAFLRGYRGTALIVSHDREFLERTVNAIVEIDEHTRTTRRFAGGYDAYHAQKQRERRKWESDWEAQQDEIRALRLQIKETGRRNDNYRAHADGDKLIRNAKIAQHDRTVSKRVRDAEERLSRILEAPLAKPPRELAFDTSMDAEAFRGGHALWASGLTVRYGERAVLDGVSLALDPRARVILVGPNGAGKSTLLRALAGIERPTAGEIYAHPAARLGYLPQEDEPDATPDARPAFEAYLDGLDGEPNALKARLLEMGLFRYDELDVPARALSAGQKRKLRLARLIALRANLLLLDEPTNHVSFDVLEGLEAALRDFPGAMMAATHDRRFIRNLCAGDARVEIWEVRDGALLRNPVGEGAYLAAG
jgi:macrolide transport system ATP-binding/permease protein